MSMRFWASSGVMLTGAVVLGLTVGGYATHNPSRDMTYPLHDIVEDQADAASVYASAGSPDRGPGTIRCTGCGPTLAERRMAADNAGWDADGMIGGTSDPVVADYLAQADSQSPSDFAPTPPSEIHRLPANIQRFADGAPPPVLARTVARTVEGAEPPQY